MDAAREAAAPGAPMLFQPIRLRGVTARNRIVVAPMCQYVSEEGGPTDWHLVHLGQFAIGGAGIVFGDETAVEPRGRKTHHCAGIYDDRHIAQYRRVTDFLRHCGAVPAIQLGHSGRRGSNTGAMSGFQPLTADNTTPDEPPWATIAPSALAHDPRFQTPHALDHAEIRQVVAAWGEAARRSVDAGFDVVEIHGAHGYLIHQFLSPIANKRTDAYGGDRAGRMRFVFELTEAVRAAWPADRPLFYRCSAVDGKGGAWDMEDTIALSKGLVERGVDVVDCSVGGMTGASAMPDIPLVPGYLVGYAARIRREAHVPTMTVGLITEPAQAEDILRRGEADLIGMARELMYEAHWPAAAARALGVKDYLGTLPSAYSFRLRRREENRAQYPEGSAVRIPHTADHSADYQWRRWEPSKD